MQVNLRGGTIGEKGGLVSWRGIFKATDVIGFDIFCAEILNNLRGTMRFSVRTRAFAAGHRKNFRNFVNILVQRSYTVNAYDSKPHTARGRESQIPA
jgi:hypothetical protein